MQPAWTRNPTQDVRRDQVKPGMIVHSSHGYRLLVTEVLDTATNRTDSRHVQITGHLHADRYCDTRSERYEAGGTIPVELATMYPRQLPAARVGHAGYGVPGTDTSDYLSDGYDNAADATQAAYAALAICASKAARLEDAAMAAALVWDLTDWQGVYERLATEAGMR